MNNVTLTGRLTKDPQVKEVTYTGKDGQQKTSKNGRFTIAVDNRSGETSFIPVETWGGISSFIEKYAHKGIKLEIVGKLRTFEYTDKKTNQKVYGWSVVAEEVNFAESKAHNERIVSGDVNAATQPAPQQAAPQSEEFLQVPEGIEDNLPFDE